MDPRDLFLNHYAFLVGIDEYDHFDNLQGAHSDATTLRDALHWVGYQAKNILLVSPEKTALVDLKREINKFLDRVCDQGSNPDIVVFWAGHGVPGDDGGFLIARDTTKDSVGWRRSAVSLGRLAEKFKRLDPASLTMFFDVCHSVPSNLDDDLGESPRERILARMRDAVRTTFVGVSTFAHEIPVWNKAHETKGKSAGILADAVQRAVRGERRDDKDHELSHDSDFAVTDEDILYKLDDAVRRKAKEVRVSQELSIRVHHIGGKRSVVGFAVRSFAKDMLEKLKLPVEADCLSGIAIEKDSPRRDHLTNFGREMVEFVAKLTRQEVTKDDFLQKERELVCREILARRTDPHLGSYVYFLLHCREEARRDNGAKNVLEKCYEYLLSGGSPESLGSSLHGPYRTFAIRHALPWSCGIPVLDNNGEVRYAPIIFHGAPIPMRRDTQRRTFVTTAQLQREALLNVWRTDPASSTLRGWPDGNCCHRTTGRFSKVMPMGARVWVRIGLDAQGCNANCDRMSVPMRIMLGREGNSDCDWQEHWHLKLDRWPELREAWAPGSEPSWAVRLRWLMDECALFLEALLTNSEAAQSQEDDEVAVHIKWLYLADMMMRMLDESRLESVTLELIAAWRNQMERNVLRLSGALRSAMEAEPGAGENGVDDRAGRGTYRERGNAILEEFARWQVDQPSEPSDSDAVGRSELLAWLLRAVMSEGAEASLAVRRLVELVTMGNLAPSAALGTFMTAGASVVPGRWDSLIERLARGAEDLRREEGASLLREELAILQTLVQLADRALERGQLENANLFLAQMRESTRIGTWLLAREFWNLTGRPELRRDFDALVTRLRLAGDQSEAREHAEEMYRWLHQLQLNRPRRDREVPREATDVLLVLISVLRPASAAIATKVINTDADRTDAYMAINAFVRRDRLDLIDVIDMIQAVDDDERRFYRISLAEQVMRDLPDFAQGTASVTSRWSRWWRRLPRILPRQPTPEPIVQDHPRTHNDAEEQSEQPYLAVPPGERQGPP